MTLSLFSGIECDMSFNSDWSQLNVLWNKNINYNWYEFTFLNANFEYYSDSVDSLMRKKYDRIWSICIELGLLGFNLSFNVDRYERKV